MSERSPVPPRPCVVCTEMFNPPHGHTKVCSNVCRLARDRATKASKGQPTPEKLCSVCGKSFTPYRPHQEVCKDTECRRVALCRRMKAWTDSHPGYYTEYKAAQYAADRPAQIAKARAWYLANRERADARTREYVRLHPDQRKETIRRYKQSANGRLTDLASVHRRLARKHDAPGTASAAQLSARWAYYGGLCWMCGQPADQWDHVIALARGGSGWPSNLRPACAFDNQSKGASRWRQP